MAKTDIRRLTLTELEQAMADLNEPAYRAKQVYHWLWQKGKTRFVDMSNLSKALRANLDTHFDIHRMVEDLVQHSSDGTIKTRFKLFDDHRIESVLIPVPEQRRYTVCVSSQVGCSLSCTFCATGRMKRVRNLEAGEIYDQVFQVNQQSLKHFDQPLTNVVYMGMGEPLLTYQNVLRSVDLLCSPDGLNMSPKRITVSTAGIAKMIRKLAEDQVKFNLALSLHAADDAKRSTIMPINDHNNLDALFQALRFFYRKTRGRISYEYIAFRDFNDSLEDAKLLLSYCRSFPVRVNIIEYNPIDGASFRKADVDNIDRFAAFLSRHGVTVTVRRSRGKDIDAACGQLANKS